MTVKVLGADYTEFCKDVERTKTRVGGSIPLSDERYQELKEHDNFYRIGYFNNDTLISWLNISFHQSDKLGKFWAVIGFYIVEQGDYFSFRRPEFGDLLETAFKLAEDNGYFQYFYCVAERVSKVYERQWSKYNPLNYHGRYELTTKEIVPPNTRPESELAWGLMGCELKPDSMHIKARILKGYNPHDK